MDRLPFVPYRNHISGLRPFVAQAPLEQLQAQLGVERMVKLSSNEGAFGPVAGVEKRLAERLKTANRYPDSHALALREALAHRHRVRPDQIAFGNGADELIRLAGLATLDSGDNGVFAWPSFPTYIAACEAVGAEARRVPLGDDWQIDVDRFVGACDSRTGVVFITNPNNPTGLLIGRNRLSELVEALPPTVLCVLDEAYAEYADGDDQPDGMQLVRAGRERTVVLRTFSKIFGLAALRIGYAVCSRDAADALNSLRNIFNVNQLAQDAALESLAAEAEIARRAEHTKGARTQIFKWLALAGHEPVASRANFVLARAARGDGVAVASDLLKEGVMIRALDGFGAPDSFRVTVGTNDENAFFAAALDRLVSA